MDKVESMLSTGNSLEGVKCMIQCLTCPISLDGNYDFYVSNELTPFITISISIILVWSCQSIKTLFLSIC